MIAPLDLQQALGELLGDAQLVACELPGTKLKLWLIDGDNMDRAFSPEETRRILHEPPYWSFCWASGLAVARYLAEHPHWVVGKRVLDFGAGSGVAAIAAVKAGALEVVACDLDPLAIAACRANAELNDVQLRYSTDFSPKRIDLIWFWWPTCCTTGKICRYSTSFSAVAGKRWWRIHGCGIFAIRCIGASRCWRR